MKRQLIILFLFSVGFSNLKCQTLYNLAFDKSEKGQTPDTLKSLQSLKKAGAIFYYTQYGDYNNTLTELNNYYKKNPYDTLKINCSIYSALGDRNNIIFGRNFDDPGMLTD